MIYGKVWGTTEPLLVTPMVEVHRIKTNEGYRCSEHMHQYKWNGFYCIGGMTKIHVRKNNYDLTDVTVLGPGDFTSVKPCLYHTFEGLEDGMAFELYWANFQHNDIQRESVGHFKSGNVVRLDKKNDKTKK